MRFRIILVFCAVFPFGLSQAATFCVTSSAELQQALDTAESNGQDDVLRVASGTYNAPPGGFIYTAAASEDFDLEISGGWTEFFGNDCGQQLEAAPTTTINGQQQHRALEIFISGGDTIRISRLAFINGFVADPLRGAGLWVRSDTNFTGAVFIERNLFFNNQAKYAGGLQASISGSGLIQMHVINNVFRLNRARTDQGAASLLVNGGTASVFGARLVVVNNTVVNNFVDSDGSEVTGGLDVRGNVPSKYVINNNLWDNEGVDLNVVSSPTFSLFNNNIQASSFSSLPSSEGGNVSIQPLYEPCQGLLCFTGVPLPGSALHDAGRDPGMLSSWSIGPNDYRGRVRNNETSVDIGAFESHARFFADRFED